jgi:putative DNA primase/helicase
MTAFTDDDNSGFPALEKSKIRQLAELAEADPMAYARRKPDAAADLQISLYDLDRMVREKQRELAQPQKPQKPQPQPGEWEKPDSLIETEKPKPYPIFLLPGRIGEAVQEVIGFVQCPPALAACSALAVVSTACQGLADVRRAGGLEGPASLFIVALGGSGDRKSTADNLFSQSIDQWEREQAAALKPVLKRFEADFQVWEAKKAGLLAKIKDTTKAGKDTIGLENQLIAMELEKPQKPSTPRLKYVDATQEELAHRLAHDWPTGGILSAEGGAVFGGAALGKDNQMKSMSLFNCLWSGESYRVDRRTTTSYTLRDVRLTVGIAIQPETIRSFLDSSNGLARGIGLLARFLIAWPESTQGTRKFQEPPEEWPALSRFHRRIAELLNTPLPVTEKGSLAPTVINLSPEAKKIWVRFHDDVEVELSPGRDMAETRDVASKTADNAARIACLFHVFEKGTGGAIENGHMVAGAKIALWHLYEARRFMREMAVSEEASKAQILDEWLIAYCKKNNTQELSTAVIQKEGPNKLRKKAALEPAMEELQIAGRIRLAEEAKKRTIYVNPYLLGVNNGS